MLPIFLYCLGGLVIVIVVAPAIFRFAVKRGGRKVQPIDPTTWINEPQVEAEVLRYPDDSLKICWRGDAEQVKIFAYTDINNPDSGKFVDTISNQSEAIITNCNPGNRVYFNLIFIGGKRDGETQVVSERFLPLESVNNIRDIGGYCTTEGKILRWGRIYRSGNLSQLNDEEKVTLQNLGIKLVFDLRSTATMSKTPDNLPPGIKYLHSPVYEDEFNKEIFPAFLFNRHKLGEILGNSYTKWLKIGAPAYGQLFKQFANPDNLPMIFHCTAGKDRVGIATAILLSLLGVPKETIIADYSLTNQVFDKLYQDLLESDQGKRIDFPPEEIKVMLAANPSWMIRALNLIQTEFGSAENYLHKAAGLTQATTEAIRTNLLSD